MQNTIQTSPFLITDERTFLAYVEKVMEECDLNQESFVFPEVDFKGWPQIHFNVKGGEKYHSSVTTYLIDGLKDFTDEIFRAYCIVKYGVPDLRRMKESDRKAFDLVIKIAEGSSDGTSDASEIAKSFFTNMNDIIKSMNGWQKLAAFVAYIGVLGGLGYFGITKYAEFKGKELDANVEQQRIQSQSVTKLNETHQIALSAQAEAFIEVNKQHEETIQKMIVLQQQGSSAIQQELHLRGELAQTNFMRQIAKDPAVTEAKVNQLQVSGEDLQAYTNKATNEKGRLDKVGNFYIKGVELTGTLGEYLSVTARRDDGLIFTLKVKAENLPPDQRRILANELVVDESQRTFVRISYKETTRNGKKSGVGELISVAYKEIP